MSKLCFHVSSITNAMRGKQVLENNGIRAFISRTSDDTMKKGCGYCITVTSNMEQAEKLLSSIGVRIRGKQRIEDA